MRASIELSPVQIVKAPEALRQVPVGNRVYMVDVGTTDIETWGRAARHVVEAGLEPVPHIAARRVASRADLVDRLAHLTVEAGVRDVLLIGGGVSSPVGPFASSMAVLETGLLDRHGISRIGIAGHPEGSPDITAKQIVDALRWKQAFRDRTGARLRIVTQFNFDPASAIAWARTLAAQGFDLPVHLGIAGPTSMTSLLKYAALCGVRASASFALKRTSVLASLAGSYSPEPYARAIEAHVNAEPACLIRQLHVFPFGGLKLAAPWLTGRGSWIEGSRAIIDGEAEGRTGRPSATTVPRTNDGDLA